MQKQNKSLWPELEPLLDHARDDLHGLVNEIVSEIPNEVFESKFKIGEEEHSGEWLDFTENDCRNNAVEELVDAIVYLAMRRWHKNAASHWTDEG